MRHNQYNSDVDTKAMRASAPLIPVWDDHGQYPHSTYHKANLYILISKWDLVTGA